MTRRNCKKTFSVAYDPNLSPDSGHASECLEMKTPPEGGVQSLQVPRALIGSENRPRARHRLSLRARDGLGELAPDRFPPLGACGTVRVGRHDCGGIDRRFAVRRADAEDVHAHAVRP